MRKLNKEYLDLANNFNQKLKERYKYNEPFEIEIIFIIGRSGNSFLFFDSIIRYWTLLYCLKEKFYNLSYDFDEEIKIAIPIAKENYDNDYFYLCGGFFNSLDKFNFFTKRTEEPIISIVKEKRVRINGGVLKNCKRVITYDIKKQYKIKGIGDIEMIEKIMPHFRNNFNIGKNTAIGFGECRMKIKSISKLELFDNETKTYIRPIPVEYLRQKKMPIINIIQSVFRPPYYGVNAKYEECGI